MTVKQACSLNDGALNIRISDGVKRFDEKTQNKEDKKFVKHFYLTKEMFRLIQEVFKRLSGVGRSPVFRLKQGMGGGKTFDLYSSTFYSIITMANKS